MNDIEMIRMGNESIRRHAERERTKLAKAVARGMCAAYWRGKFEAEGVHPNQIESLIERYMETNWQGWVASARHFISIAD